MRKIGTEWTLLVTLASLIVVASSAWSAEEEKQISTDNPWDLSPTALPFATPDSSISIGIGILDGDRQQLGMFTGKNDSHEWLLLDTNIRKRDDATGIWGLFKGTNLGMDNNREMMFNLEKQGEWGLRIDHDEMTRIAPYTVNSMNQGLGTPFQTISNSSTPGTGSNYSIKTDRDRLALTVFRNLNKNIKINLDLKNENKEGTRQWGRGSINSVNFLLEPIHWSTLQLDPTISYVSNDLQLLGGYNGSWFKNQNNLVDTINEGANPSIVANHAFMTLPLNNEAHQFFLSGGYGFSPLTRGTFKLSYTRALSNEHLPTSDIKNLALSSGPTELNGEVNSTLLMLGLTTQPIPKLSLSAKFRYFDEDDKTPAWLIAETPATATAPKVQVHSTPISSRTITSLLEGTYRLPYDMAVTGGVERKDQKRQVPFGNDIVADGLDDERFVPWRTNSNEMTYRMSLSRRLSEDIDGTVALEHGVRRGSSYVDSVKIMGNAQGKINPYFIADRDRDKLRLTMDWRPIDRLGVQVAAENSIDRYGPDQLPYGQRKGNASLYSLDIDYAPVDRWLFTAWYSFDVNRIYQDSGRWSTTGVHEVDKSSYLKDTGSSIGLGIRNQWDEHTKIGSNFQWTRNKSTFSDTVVVDPANKTTTAYPAGLSPLPGIVTPGSSLNTFVEYRGLGPGVLRGDYTHERWRTNDWTWKFSDGSTYVYNDKTDSTMVSSNDTQTSDYIGIVYTTTFK
ncbi:MAG: MtrB/PioB family decaheme-associated outer membrane protein [Magnetococcales bacterium]|nr:MtrB/PioB family decaheme-associated outer membrane protein [Magnetococcales bacterium]